MTSNDQGPSSIEAWEAEYQALQARKGVVRSQPQQDGGFFGKIGQAFTQVLVRATVGGFSRRDLRRLPGTEIRSHHHGKPGSF